MKNNKDKYDEEWAKIKKDIIKAAIKYKMNHNVYIHKHMGYFENRYR